jgi:hypothetical protein
VAATVLAEIEGATNGWFLRGHGAVGQAFEKLISAKCMVAFFKTGRLVPKAEFVSRYGARFST